MWKCHKCGKPVYFAERKQSLGHDWHPECLRCEECGKRLNPAQHAEHKGVPYCDIPCYSVLFGPTLFGHGSQVEAHTSFGKMEKKLPPGIDRAILESKLKAYNQYYEGNSGQLKWKERNGKLILEGVLRIHWGVNKLIHLKENEDQRHHVQVRKRYSYRDPRSSRRTRNFENGDGQNSENGKGDLRFEKCSTLTNLSRQPAETEPVGSSTDVALVDTEDRSGMPNGENNSHSVDSTSGLSKEGIIGIDTNVNEGVSGFDGTKSSTDEADVPANINIDGNAIVEAAASPTDGVNAQEVTLLKYDTINDPEEQIASRDVRDGSAFKVDDPKTDCRFQLSDDDDDEEERNLPKRERIDLSRVKIRKLTSSRSKTKLRRRCSINGHYYNRETKTFTPPHGSATNVWVTSMVNTSEVINLLLDKFCVENSPEDFALFVVRDNGEIRRIKEEEYPLLARVILGPHEEVVKVYIMDKKQTNEISNEVAQYLNFQEPELNAILHKFYEEENREVKKLKLKYAEMRRRIKAKLAAMDASRQTTSVTDGQQQSTNSQQL